jgi:hypothetical protein
MTGKIIPVNVFSLESETGGGRNIGKKQPFFKKIDISKFGNPYYP